MRGRASKQRGRIRHHLRAHGFGYLVLFVALGGTAYATHSGGANTIDSVDIRDGEVRAVDLAAEAVGTAALENGGVGGAEVLDGAVKTIDVGDEALRSVDVANSDLRGVDFLDDTLTGADLDEATLQLGTEPWHEVGAPGEPPFNDVDVCRWQNSDPATYNTAAFARDPHGIVRLKGRVQAVDIFPEPFNCNFFSIPDTRLIFTLPAGYRPEKRDAHLVLTNFALGRVNVDPDGRVSVDPPTSENNARQWLSLDGISFRCVPSGSDGCP
jgi:hypothetical protein